MKKRILLFPFAISLLLAACSADLSIEKKEVQEDIVVMNTAQALQFKRAASPYKMDPQFASDTFSFTINNNIYEGLYRSEKNGIEPGIAKGYTVSEDQKTYTFTLRKNAKWSNGDPVTAHDFVYAWQRAVDPSNDLPSDVSFSELQNYNLITTKDHDDFGKAEKLGVQAIDDYTLEVVFENSQPENDVLNMLTQPHFVPQDSTLAKKIGKDYGTSLENLAFNGPFILRTYEENKELVLAKNEQYWAKEVVKLDEIHYALIKSENFEQAKVLEEFKKDVISAVSLNEAQINLFQKDTELVSTPSSTVSYLQFNQKTNEQLNKAIRSAISLSLDKKEINQRIYEGANIPLSSFVPRNLTEKEETTGTSMTANKEKAREFFQKGLKELDHEEVTLKIGAFSPSKTLQQALVELKHQLEENLPGLQVEIAKYTDINVYTSDIANGEIDLFWYELSPGEGKAGDYLSVFKSNHPFNLGKFSNENYDALLKKMNDSSLEEEIHSLQNEAEKLLLEEEVAIIPMMQQKQYTLLQDFVKNWYQPAIGYPSYKYTYIKED